MTPQEFKTLAPGDITECRAIRRFGLCMVLKSVEETRFRGMAGETAVEIVAQNDPGIQRYIRSNGLSLWRLVKKR